VQPEFLIHTRRGVAVAFSPLLIVGFEEPLYWYAGLTMGLEFPLSRLRLPVAPR
jgi:hypothetical protein